jgi:hypothetical protein
MNKTLGMIVLGLFGLAWGGFTYTTSEKVVDIGLRLPPGLTQTVKTLLAVR